MCQMGKEHEIICEIGPKNWLDTVAGEALLLGSLTYDKDLEMAGNLLAKKLSEVNYYSDSFSQVQAMGVDLVKRVEEVKTGKPMLFIDEISVRSEVSGKKSLNSWEYDLLLANGTYRIYILFPEYYGPQPPDQGKEEVVGMIRKSISEAFGGALRVEKYQKKVDVQTSDVSDYYTANNDLVGHVVDFNHECGYKRGIIEHYYMRDYAQAIKVWEKAKTILNRKR